MFKTFNVSDVILVACSTDPFQILKKLNYNTYVIYLSKDFGISFIFNIGDLVDFNGITFNSRNFFIDEPSYEPIFERYFLSLFSNILPNTVDKIDKILDDEVITTNRYLI